MAGKKWLLGGSWLLISGVAFSLSMFRIGNPVWIAAWIAPVFMIRFMRSSRWLPAVVLGFLVLQVAVVVGLLPLMDMVGATSVEMDAKFFLTWQIRSGMLFVAVLSLVPLVLDKALHTCLPNWAATLVYPAAVVAVELLSSFTTGTNNTFGETQFALRPLVMSSSLFGIFGLSFLVAWFAPMVNRLWDEDWRIRRIGFSGAVFGVVVAAMLVYGAVAVGFPGTGHEVVPLAGITTDVTFDQSIADSGLSVSEVLDLDSEDYAELMSSPRSRMDEMRRKTLEASVAGAKIVIWQETALMLESSVADAFLTEMQSLADEEDIYLLVSYERLLNDNEREDRAMRNTGVLFTPEGNVGWQYSKAFPVPGFEDQFAEPGTRDIPYLDTPFGRIGQVICADMERPHYLRQAASRQIELLFVPSWDTTAYTPLSTFNSGYRAVEYGFTMVKITGDGHSAVIDPYFRHWAGQNSLEQGTRNFYVNVPVVSRTTFYHKIGFVVPYFVLALLLSLVAWGIGRRTART